MSMASCGDCDTGQEMSEVNHGSANTLPNVHMTRDCGAQTFDRMHAGLRHQTDWNTVTAGRLKQVMQVIRT